MQRYRLPQTDLEVSALCFGAGSLGTATQGAATDRLLAAYLEAGGNFFDTAHCYAAWVEKGEGVSERELAASLRRLGAFDRVVIATKGGHPAFGDFYPRPDDFLSERVLAADIDDSLNRLGVETIDLYYLHRDDGRTPVEVILEALNREVARGRLRYLAASNWSVKRLADANQYAAEKGLRGFVASQVQWSLAVPNWPITEDPTTRYVTQKEIAWHTAAGIPLIPYSATAGGYFAGTPGSAALYDNPTSRARRERARTLSAELGCTPTQIALAYLRHQTPTVIPIFGTTNPAHLSEALGSLSVKLSAAQTRWLRDGAVTNY